ncbi:hypothetical protein LCGC14_2367480 [marine sediment metagenome]|uniref:Uncharacterized protein n=1 Tax=marine sediment metagenome TaxID=412755 RepID=A0A0F9C4R5_9ZZZZ
MYGILRSQVPRERVELSRLAAQVFEACASTNFAISAGAGTAIAGHVLMVSTSPASHVTTRAASSGRQLMARDGHGGSEGIRTLSLLLDRQLLYPIELRNHKVERIGVEPTQPKGGWFTATWARQCPADPYGFLMEQIPFTPEGETARSEMQGSNLLPHAPKARVQPSTPIPDNPCFLIKPETRRRKLPSKKGLWYTRHDLNVQPLGSKPSALSIELRVHEFQLLKNIGNSNVAIRWTVLGSNQSPPDCKTGALPK